METRVEPQAYVGLDSRLDPLINYPSAELYRLIVDGQFHQKEKGFMAYEGRQPGCLKAAFDGLALAISNLDDTHLTIHFIVKLHEVCMSNVQNLKEGTIPGKIRKEEDIVGFYMPPRTITEAGLLDVFEFIENQTQYNNPDHGSWIGPPLNLDDAARSMGKRTLSSIDPIRSLSHRNIAKQAFSLREMARMKFRDAQENEFNHYLAPHSNKVADDLKNALNKYNHDIKMAKTPDEKLATIVELIWVCDHIHPFMDGNIRTFAVLLLNRLLLQSNFPPVTLIDPNKFDCHSKNEMVNEVKVGMQNTLDLINGAATKFNFNSEDIVPEEQSLLQGGYAKHFLLTLGQEQARLKIHSIKEKIVEIWGKQNSHYSFHKSSTLNETVPADVEAQWKLIKKAEKHGTYGDALSEIVKMADRALERKGLTEDEEKYYAVFRKEKEIQHQYQP